MLIVDYICRPTHTCAYTYINAYMHTCVRTYIQTDMECNSQCTRPAIPPVCAEPPSGRPCPKSINDEASRALVPLVRVLIVRTRGSRKKPIRDEEESSETVGFYWSVACADGQIYKLSPQSDSKTRARRRVSRKRLLSLAPRTKMPESGGHHHPHPHPHHPHQGGPRSRDFVRVILQALMENGFQRAADALCEESGVELEAPAVGEFRQAILNGDYERAHQLLPELIPPSSEPQKKKAIVFEIERERFLELLECRKKNEALDCLRNSLTPAASDPKQIRQLAGFITCTHDRNILHEEARWHGTGRISREELLQRIHGYLPSDLLIEPHRIDRLFEQALAYQATNCRGHYGFDDNRVGTELIASNGLLSDHQCSRESSRFTCYMKMTVHSDEVLHAAFSHNGQYLATASRDRTVLIWKLPSGDLFNTLSHSSDVVHVSWRDDDSQLLTCSLDSRARIWDIPSGTCNHIFLLNGEATVGVWTSESDALIIASQDGSLTRFSHDGRTLERRILRCLDLKARPNGDVLALDHHRSLNVLDHTDLSTKSKINILEDDEDMSSTITLSRDGDVLLVSEYGGSLLGRFERDDSGQFSFAGYYNGHPNQQYVLRPCFARDDEGLIVVGGEDGRLYVYERGDSTPLESLEEHTMTINSVDWTDQHGGILASVSDDKTVCLWRLGAGRQEAARSPA